MGKVTERNGNEIGLRAFGPSFLGLPVVVARADAFVSIVTRRHAQALSAALLAEEHAWLVVLRLPAPSRAPIWAFCAFFTHFRVATQKKKRKRKTVGVWNLEATYGRS